MDPTTLTARQVRIDLSGRTILRDIHCDVATGSWVSLVGANGAGKSTLLRSLAGWHRPKAGQVLLAGGGSGDGDSGSGGLVDPLADVLLVPQPEDLPTWLSGRELLDICVAGRMRRPPEGWAFVLDLLDAGHWMDRPVSALSLGTRKKLCIATALCTGPRLLLLDEAFDGLDARASVRIRGWLRQEVTSGRPGILSASHAWEAVFADSDSVLFLDGGRIVRTLQPGAFDHLARQAAALQAAVLEAFETGGAGS